MGIHYNKNNTCQIRTSHKHLGAEDASRLLPSEDSKHGLGWLDGELINASDTRKTILVCGNEIYLLIVLINKFGRWIMKLLSSVQHEELPIDAKCSCKK